MNKIKVVPIHLGNNTKVLYQNPWILIYSVKAALQEIPHETSTPYALYFQFGFTSVSISGVKAAQRQFS